MASNRSWLLAIPLAWALVGCSSRDEVSVSSQALDDASGPHVPAPGPNPELKFHGGTVLSHPVFFTIYFGDYWQDSELSAQLYINSFVREFGTSAMADVVADYGVGQGRFGGTAVVPANLTNDTVSDAAVRDAVRAAIRSGDLPLEHQGIYFVYLPPGKTASAGGGYHQRFTDSSLSDQPIVYGALALYLGDQGLDLATQGTSHELTEAETDPHLDGWFTDAGDEIADLVGKLGVDPVAARDRSGFMVQLMWSNKDKVFEIAPAGRVNASDEEPVDQCSSGSKQCVDGDRYQDCGDFDGNGTTEWSNPYSCSASWPGTTCSDGWCVAPPPPADQCSAGSKQCLDGDQYQECGDFDSNGSTEWSGAYSCSASWPGTSCSDGWCVGPPPTDECSAGSKQCVDGDQYQDCGDFAGDGNTEWSSPFSCSASWPGTVCSDGWCVGGDDTSGDSGCGDTSSDPNNCGSCSNSCYDQGFSGCDSGQCY